MGQKGNEIFSSSKKRAIAILLLALIIAGSTYALIKVSQNKPKEEENRPSEPAKNESRSEALTFEPISGWHNSQEASWYNFMETRPEIGNLYVLVTGFDDQGNPVPVAGQGDIFDRKKDEPDPISFWRILYVTVPGDYQVNSVKSAPEIVAKGWPTKDSGRVMNRPFALAEDKIVPDRQKLEGWVEGEKVYSWQFEDSVNKDPGDANQVLAGSVYVFISGYDGSGNPTRVPDQGDIIESAPGEQNYSPLMKVVYVEVPSGYQASSIRSKDEIVKQGLKLNESKLLVDLSVYKIENKTVLTVPSGSAPALGADKPDGKSGKISFKSKISVKTSGGTSSQIQIKQRAVSGPEPKVEQMVSVTVLIRDLSFQPSSIEIPADSTVTWINNDSVDHTMTADDGRFDSGVLAPGQSFKMVFTTPGDRSYHCTIHPSMKGIVSVK